MSDATTSPAAGSIPCPGSPSAGAFHLPEQGGIGMAQDHEVPGDTPPPVYHQQLDDLASDCASVLELLESIEPHGKAWPEVDR